MERTILIVEDSATQSERLRLLLEGQGYRVERAANGREGLERVQVAPPDLIVSDVVMPEMDGYAFCRAVKSVERLRRIPFVLLTERNTPADIIKGFERGADNFITKPFEDDHLLERVRRIFEHLELRRQGHLDVEISLKVGHRQIVVNADKQQMIELLFSTLEEVVRLNGRLAESQRAVEEYARSLEAKVEERTRQLLQAEKIATMGQLLAGVAHELNNPLAVVLGQAALLRQTPGGERVPHRAEAIARAAERCARIVRNFLSLARQHPPAREVVSLNRVVEEALELLAYQFRVDGVEVTLDLAEDLPALWADPTQLYQVVVNLMSNAHYAMRETAPPRGLSLSTRHAPGRASVRLEVGDTGPGIAPEIQGRIFEPFFTTKPPGQGTGLGLSLVQGFIEGHGGRISVESQLGQGAVFSVELPVVAAASRAVESAAGEAPPANARAAILVVDDEPGVVDILAEILTAEGHVVETASNGAIALEKLRARVYDLILTDLRMPELDGPGLYRELERRSPGLERRVVFLTGDALSPEIGLFLEEVGLPTISKPFVLSEVRTVIRQALHEA